MTFRTCVQPLVPSMSSDISHKKVMIIDDNTAVRDMLRNRLEAWNMIVSEAGSGKQALEILSDRPDVDLILTDLQMPGYGGLKLCKEFQKRHPELPVIAMSGSGPVPQNEDLQNALKAGARGIVAKPFKLDEFYSAVAYALGPLNL